MLYTNKSIFSIIILFFYLNLTGCSIYKLDIRQGNEIDPKKLDLLKPRQTKDEVQNILGPVTLDPINPNRLDYYFSFSPSGNKITKKQHLILFFNKTGHLNHYISDNEELKLRFLPKKTD